METINDRVIEYKLNTYLKQWVYMYGYNLVSISKIDVYL